MERQSIATLKKLFQSGELREEEVEVLREDERKGVQALLRTYDKEKQKRAEKRKRYFNMTAHERSAYDQGYKYVAGVDEVGRGPLAGPVVAAAVILPKDIELIGLNDSKQLTEKERNYFSEVIKKEAISYSISMVHSDQIDEMNILEATKLAMEQSIEQLEQKPEHVLVDAVRLDGLLISQEVIEKGDERSISIAAASIIAKVARDDYMRKLHTKFPMYGFNSNMGYGTKEHMEQLKACGATPYHRKSFAPVRKILTS